MLPYTNSTKPFNTVNSKPTYARPEPSNNRLPRVPTKEEMNDRRKRGLCMWCRLKFGPTHQCLRSQLYHLLVEDMGDQKGEHEEITAYVDNEKGLLQQLELEDKIFVISLHALWGTEGCQTMKILGNIKK